MAKAYRILLWESCSRFSVSKVFAYFCNGGRWSRDRGEAFDFMHTGNAIAFTHRYRITDVQLAIKFLDSRFDTTFPIPVPGEAVPAA